MTDSVKVESFAVRQRREPASGMDRANEACRAPAKVSSRRHFLDRIGEQADFTCKRRYSRKNAALGAESPTYLFYIAENQFSWS